MRYLDRLFDPFMGIIRILHNRYKQHSRLYYWRDMDMNPILAPFIKMLERKGLLTFDVDGDTPKHFENRLKIQKYVYLAKFFDLDMEYSHSMYRYGPYSPTLAEDYYELGQNHTLYNKMVSTKLPSFNLNGFLNLVNGKDPKWLEIAATLLDVRSRISDKKGLINYVNNIKYGFTTNFIERVYNDLRLSGRV